MGLDKSKTVILSSCTQPTRTHRYRSYISLDGELNQGNLTAARRTEIAIMTAVASPIFGGKFENPKRHFP